MTRFFFACLFLFLFNLKILIHRRLQTLQMGGGGRGSAGLPPDNFEISKHKICNWSQFRNEYLPNMDVLRTSFLPPFYFLPSLFLPRFFGRMRGERMTPTPPFGSAYFLRMIISA